MSYTLFLWAAVTFLGVFGISTMTIAKHIHSQEDTLSSAMRKAQQGDAAAYQELLEAVTAIMQVYVSRSLKRMGIQDACSMEDLVQEILLALHAKRHTFDSSQLFTPWLFAIARYKVIDFGRNKLKEQGHSPIEDHAEHLEAPIFSEPGSESDLKNILQSLNEKSRKLLELVKLENFSIAEAAAMTQMSPSAVKVSIHRSLKKLQMLALKSKSKESRADPS